jgi:hypothetical protein
MLTTVVIVANIILYISLSLIYGWGISLAYFILMTCVASIKCSPTFSVFLAILGICWFGKIILILYVVSIISLVLCIADCSR